MNYKEVEGAIEQILANGGKNASSMILAVLMHDAETASMDTYNQRDCESTPASKAWGKAYKAIQKAMNLTHDAEGK